MRNGRRTGSVIDDDIRSSLDLLDGVIGEFDDGLTSSAESEATHQRHERNRARARAGGRSEMEDRVRPELRSSNLSINDQIDNIFSQLTQEIYNDEKVNKETKVRLGRSPTRNRFDPLPPPPTSSTQTHPPPIDRKKKPADNISSSKYGGNRLQDTKTLTNDKPRPSRPKYVKSSDRQNFSLPHEKMKNGKGNGEVILYEDHEFSNTMEKVVADVHKNADYAKQVPPPMPEKQRIHLKNASIDRNKETSKSFLHRQQQNLSSQEAAVMQELKEKVTDKQGKISKFDNRRGRPQQKRPGKRAETHSYPRQPPASQQNNLYESMAPTERRMRQSKEDYRRSRSMGPLDTREPRQRSRSRGGREKVMSPPSPAEAEETIAKLLPRYPQGLPPERQRSMIDLRVMEEVKKNQRRSMAVGPYEDLPPHLRNHLMPSAFRNPNSYRIPAYIDEQLRFQHQMNIEAQREHLLNRGFPVSHPLVSGEIPLHPELRGQLHFEIPSRTTLPLGPEDYRRFMPEMSRKGMQSAFPGSQATDFTADGKRVARQLSRRENSFVGLTDRKKKEKHDNSRNKSEESKSKPFSWLNSGFGGKQKEEMAGRASHHDQQWFMREREDMKSMPPVHIADDFDAKSKVLNRDDKSRSSFGMILKDKFQKNPNMYFPDTPGPRTSSKPSEFVEMKSGNKTSKTTSKSSLKQPDSLSDTDTLIHNMSEGSFDKDCSLSGGHSIGSNKSSRSSGKSSSHSHDSMNGTPRMIRRSESITTPKQPVNTSFIIPTNPSVILNKKTIRNYVPPESNNMLRNFEDNRKTSNKPQNLQEKIKNRDNKSERKSSVEKLIDDFHRNLPSPPPSKAADLSLPFSDADSLFSGLTMDTPRKDTSSHRAGTVTSQTSHWSVASSAASFDYHSVNSMENKKKMSNDGPAARRKNSDHAAHSSHLPSLNELEVGERIPPEGAAAESPANTGRKINEDNKNLNKKTVSKAKEAVSDLIKATDEDDDLHLLRKLISEGRISGLNEKPPPFIPPTPPSKISQKRKVEGQAGVGPGPAVKTSEEKDRSGRAGSVPPAKSADRPRKSREAPKPPTQTQIKPPPVNGNSDVKFISGRRINSVESINQDPGSGSGLRNGGKNIKRSTSMHVPKDKVRDDDADDAALAQLIADSTEKRFKISNILKVKWKKKHYSFDLG